MTTQLDTLAAARRQPYIYVTWITKLLAGEASCEFAPWFRSHYKYEKLPSDFNLAVWSADHTELLQNHTARLRETGYTVTVEDQNAFRMPSRDDRFMLAGKPDLVGQKSAKALVIDVKTGAPKNSDIIQVQVYLAVLARNPKFRGLKLHGRVQYRERSVDVPSSTVDATFIKRLGRVIKLIGDAQTPLPTPSVRECSWCDIGDSYCSARIAAGTVTTITDHDIF